MPRSLFARPVAFLSVVLAALSLAGCGVNNIPTYEQAAKAKLKAQEMGGDFAYALIFLQIALMLASISSLTKRKYLWYIALVCNVGWLFFFLDAWLLFY